MITPMRVLARLIAAAVLLPAAPGGTIPLPQQRRAPAAEAAPDVTRLGPQVGDLAPDFSLPDQDGRRRTLASLMGDKGLVLVFNRSADW